jgi:hypothetical protein
MEFRWEPDDGEFELYVYGVEGITNSVGWVTRVNGGYGIIVEHTLSPEQLDCEKVTYPTELHAMLKLKNMVTVLIIGGHHVV